MLRMFHIIFLCITITFCGFAQDSVRYVRFGPDFQFADGVYINFKEWKDQAPRITKYETITTNTVGSQDEIELRYSCTDNEGVNNTCVVKNCFGFVRNGSLYISQGFYGYYFRVFIIGGLTHFLAFTGYEYQTQYFSSEPNGFIGSVNDFREYVLDFNTGEIFEFNYKNFLSFLEENDPELHKELLSAKNKRKMIHHYMLKYNERHPIYFPVE